MSVPTVTTADGMTFRRTSHIRIFPIFGGAEDPFLWVDHQGVYHVVVHNMYGCNTGIGSRPCGTHRGSRNGWAGHCLEVGLMDQLVVELSTGSDTGTTTDSWTVLARERPHLILCNSTPTHFITGTVFNGDASSTLVQPLYAGGRL